MTQVRCRPGHSDLWAGDDLRPRAFRLGVLPSKRITGGRDMGSRSCPVDVHGWADRSSRAPCAAAGRTACDRRWSHLGQPPAVERTTVGGASPIRNVPFSRRSPREDAVVWQRLRRTWKEMWTPTHVEQKYETWTCPKCGLKVEVPSSSPGVSRRPWNAGLMWLPPTEAERLAACPIHGHHRDQPA